MQNESNSYRRNQEEVFIESEHQANLFGYPPTRWEKYQIARKHFREGSPKEVFFERESVKSSIEQGGGQLREQVANTIRTNYSNGHSNETYVGEIEVVGNIYPSKHEAGNIYDPNGLSPTLKVNGPRPNSKNQAPKIFIL